MFFGLDDSVGFLLYNVDVGLWFNDCFDRYSYLLW